MHRSVEEFMDRFTADLKYAVPRVDPLEENKRKSKLEEKRMQEELIRKEVKLRRTGTGFGVYARVKPKTEELLYYPELPEDAAESNLLLFLRHEIFESK